MYNCNCMLHCKALIIIIIIKVFYLLSDVERAIFVLNKSSKDGFLKDGSREAPPKGCKR